MGSKRKLPVEKIRRRAVWPSFVGFVVVCVVFAFLYTIIIDVFIHNVIEQKNRDNYETALSVKSFFDANTDIKDVKTLPKEIMQPEQINPQIKSICLINSENELMWQTGNNKPDFEKKLEYKMDGCTIFIDHDFDMNGDIAISNYVYSDEDEDNYIIQSGNETAYQVILSNIPLVSDDTNRTLNRHIFQNMVESSGIYFINPHDTIISIPCWVVLDEDESGLKLCVEIEFLMRAEEVAPFLFALGISVFFSFIMFLWFIISLFRLISDRRRIDAILNLDQVTGGKNWLYFIKTGTKLLKRNRKKNSHYAVVSMGMRKYTNYCTYYGVSAGEELLGKFYTILQNCVKKKELAIRHERAEFGLLLLFEDEAGLEQRIKKIAFMLNSAALDQSFHFSTGVYIIDRNEDNITEIYNSAVVARNCCSDDATKQICYFTDEMYNNQVWERKVENDMEKALYNHEFELYLQPKYDTKNETLSAAEALVRWNHPTEGFVPPSKFIPIFEANGFIIQLDDYMLAEVCRIQATWIARKERVVPISVNVSRAHFTKNDLAEHICKTVDFFRVPHSVIELELTESAFFDDKAALLSTVKKLRAAGFKVSMDDFGAGYSSLNTLKELPLDVVKLDAEFFRGKDEMNRGKLIVEETINLAKKLNMQIVAEGIETREQVDFLKHNGCDLIQGFFFAKPMSVQDFEKSAFKKPTKLIN